MSERESMSECERDRERESVSECVRERVCVRERERERAASMRGETRGEQHQEVQMQDGSQQAGICNRARSGRGRCSWVQSCLGVRVAPSNSYLYPLSVKEK